ncbi:hypothetical protein B0H34DRAFT_291447 [Crassisporium funariophilum]|nr:hypothetical protein B0H34DRAFT_291447 [Crassisporium funariophilum]
MAGNPSSHGILPRLIASSVSEGKPNRWINACWMPELGLMGPGRLENNDLARQRNEYSSAATALQLCHRFHLLVLIRRPAFGNEQPDWEFAVSNVESAYWLAGNKRQRSRCSKRDGCGKDGETLDKSESMQQGFPFLSTNFLPPPPVTASIISQGNISILDCVG